jgi:hypothetical protein
VTTCPVCEHPQAAGAECEVCGRALAAFGGVDQPVAPLDGLEPTSLAAEGSAGDVGLLPELEPTLQPAAGAVAAVPVAELEPTRAAPVEAPGEPMPDLEPTAAPPSGDGRTELPLFPVCRYCRTPAGPGERLCGRCGMRLQVETGPGPGATLAGPRLCSCGAPVTRSTCPACGARHRVE